MESAHHLLSQELAHTLSLNQVVTRPGLHKVGIRGIQIRAKFKISGAKIVAGPKAPLLALRARDQRSWS